MGKNKHKRFAENLTFKNLIQPQFDEVFRSEHPLKGRWGEQVFGNSNPITVELGCGRGEYTVAMARMFPERNFIGVDIKGARMWRGAKTATEEGLSNAAFLRTRIEFIDALFGLGEIDSVWITFPDPQPGKDRAKKRLTAPAFLKMYAGFLSPGGKIHLKTDNRPLHDFTISLAQTNGLEIEAACADIYGENYADELLSVKTAYETRFLSEGLAITYLRMNLNGKTEFALLDQDHPANY